MAYTKTVWKDYPSEDTPIVSTALQNIEDGIEALDTELNTKLITAGINSGDIEIISGILKQDTTDRTKWNIIDDANHTPMGLSGTFATASGTEITVNFGKTYSEVIGFISGPDETFSKLYNMSVGASVGLSSATFELGGTLKGAGIIHHTGSAWAYSEDTREAIITSVTNSGANIAVNHSFMAGADLQVCGDTNSGTVIPLIPVTKSLTATSFAMNFLTYEGAFSTTPATNWSCRYKRQYDGVFTADGTNSWNTLPLDAGNIWFIGIFKV